MEEKHFDPEKDIKSHESTGKVVVQAAYGGQDLGDDYDYYDPSKESALTRAGLNLESFKRAPGTTRCV